MIQGKKLTKISKFSLPKGSIQNFSLKKSMHFSLNGRGNIDSVQGYPSGLAIHQIRN